MFPLTSFNYLLYLTVNLCLTLERECFFLEKNWWSHLNPIWILTDGWATDLDLRYGDYWPPGCHHCMATLWQQGAFWPCWNLLFNPFRTPQTQDAGWRFGNAPLHFRHRMDMESSWIFRSCLIGPKNRCDDSKMRWCKVPGSTGMPESYYLMTRTYNQSPDSYMILPLDLAPFTDLPVVRYWICLRHGHLLGCHQPPRAGHVLPRCVCPCREPRGESCDRQLLADLLYGARALTKSGSWDWIVYVHIDGPSN